VILCIWAGMFWCRWPHVILSHWIR